MPSFVVTLAWGWRSTARSCCCCRSRPLRSDGSLGIEEIAQTRIAGGWSWGLLALGLLVYVGPDSLGWRRHQVGLPGPDGGPGSSAAAAGGAALGVTVIAVLNSHQGVPLLVLIFAAMLGLGGYVLKETQFGLYLYGRRQQRRGGAPHRHQCRPDQDGGLGIAGAVAAIAGVLAVSRTLGVGVFSGGGVGGGTLLLESIAVAVIGGVSLESASAAAARCTRHCWAPW